LFLTSIEHTHDSAPVISISQATESYSRGLLHIFQLIADVLGVGVSLLHLLGTCAYRIRTSRTAKWRARFSII